MNVKGIVASSAVIAIALGLAGCGSSSSSGSGSGSTTTPKEAVCADRANLETSVRALTNSDTLTGGKSSIDAALKKVQKDLDALKSSAKANLKPQVDAVKSALDQLKTVLDGFGNGSITSSLTDAGNAIAKVGTSTADLATALSTECS